VPDGRIEFFRSREESKVAWLARNVSRLAYPAISESMTTFTRTRTDGNTVVATSSYGKSRRLLIWAGITIGTAATAASGWYAYKGLRSGNWPIVEGRVLHAYLDESNDTRGEKFYKAEIKYAYNIFGTSHVSDDIGFLRSPSDDVVRKLIADHPEGPQVTVYYNPSRPANSVVIPGLGPMHWLICGLSLVPLIGVLPLVLYPTTPGQDAWPHDIRLPRPRARKT
jgi:hypothetical protein